MNGDPITKAKKARAVKSSSLPDWAKEGYVPPYQDGPVLKDSNPTARLTRKVIKTSVDRPQPWDAGTVLTGQSLQKKMIKKR